MDQVSFSATQFAATPRVNMVDPAGGLQVWVLGILVTWKALVSDTAISYSFFEDIVPPGIGPPAHFHTREVETWFMIEGELIWNVGKESFNATKGCFIQLPRNVPHTFINKSDKPARLAITYAPAGFERWFIEVGQAVVDRNSPGEAPPPNPDDVARSVGLATTKYGIIFIDHAHEDKEALEEMHGSL